MSNSDGRNFFKLVSNNQMAEAKAFFTQQMNIKLVERVSKMREEVGKTFFNKK